MPIPKAKDSLEFLISQLELQKGMLAENKKKLDELTNRDKQLSESIFALRQTISLIYEKYPELKPKTLTETFKDEINEFLRAIRTVGDAVEYVLKIEISMPRAELLDLLVKQGIISSTTNPAGTLHNALMRDARKRFLISKDGIVSLRKENEQAKENG